MRRITPLILVAVAALAAMFPVSASANHGPPHGNRAVLAQ